ncbi:transmembrane protein 79 isoform X2 [Bufo gargarizans]|uniref:transmembrane protein 79 isoform X2 n=1 Tax=Bufo gargarizans TaxID=30331 RepID=UPI001CF47CE9|nr:transmembrane protein 79 isoform X2 [Bufo gargarizans]
MAGSLKVNLKPDSLEGKHIDPVGFLASRKTPEDKKKVRSVDFYELDVVKNDLEEPKTTSNVRCEVTEDKDRENLEDKKDVDSAQSNQPQENKESSNYFDQTQPSSPKLCRIKSSPTCPCKECVENYLNLRDTTEEPNVDEEKKDKAGNVRENAEEPLVDEEKKDEATPGVDRTSVRSRRVSDTSRHTDSSEDDFLGTRCEDAQVTLPYPDKNEPPECIARLSNAGLYDPSEERPGKTGDEDKISQVVINTAFFVEHPALEEQKNVRMVEYDKVDVEKGDPESEPLMRLARRSVEKEPVYPGFCQCHKACLKLVGSFVLAMIIFPAFLLAAYAWLPFDAPLIPDVPTRLVYTLRCSAFASFPIVLGVIIHGISRLCASSYDPFKPREREVTIHRRFVKQSTFLFVLFFFNLSVLATYLPQKHLKFIPLLTCLFSLSQLIYWLSFAVGRSFRGFGYGLTFLPLLSMLICNLYYMFVIEPEKMVFLGSRVVPQH